MADPTKQKQRSNLGFFVAVLAVAACAYGYNYLKVKGVDISSYLSATPKTDPALLEARLSDAEIVAFTQEAAKSIHLDAENYQRQLQAARPYFTRAGFADFVEGLQRGRLLDGPGRTFWLENIETPVVLEQREVNGAHRWDMQFPAAQRSSATLSSDLVIRLGIVRSDEPENRQGVGIAQWIAVPR